MLNNLFYLLENDDRAVAVVCGDKIISYKQLGRKIAGVLKYFQSSGVGQGDRILVNLPNGLDFLLCYMASIWGGYVVVPVNQSLPQEDKDYIMSVSRPVLVVDSALEYTEADLPKAKVSSGVFMISFTSGTTSKPKSVGHTLDNMVANVVAFNNLTGIGNNTVMLHVLPMGYMAGFLNTILSPFVAGGTVVIAPQFSALSALNFWEPAIANNCNAVWLTPTMCSFLERMLRDESVAEWTAENMKLVFVGTAPLPYPVRNSFERKFGVACLESYGMTEILLTSVNIPGKIAEKGSAGVALAGVEFNILDENGGKVAAGQEGNLYIKTDYMLAGTLADNGEIIEEKSSGDLATGDCAKLDSKGNLYITGRAKDLIIHGGTNISAKSIEDVLIEHENISEVAVVGRKHDFWGEEVVACIVFSNKNTGGVSEHELQRFCSERLNPDSVPTAYCFFDSLPKSSIGKVMKNALQEMI